MAKWKCYRCGEVYEQEAPPDLCKNCNAQVSFWIDWTDAKTPLDDPVSKYMSQELVTIDINNNVWQAAKLMKEYKVGSVFVTQNDNPVGILTERDVLYKIVAEDLPSAHVLLRKVMSSPLVSIDGDSPARKAIELMRDKGFRRLLVTNKGKPSGLVTQDDLVSKALA
ncbi:MAG: CBS domain-containing protein [archaeon]|nr:CBS domain-containing protein [archaeon]